jgi:hypothetical protein
MDLTRAAPKGLVRPQDAEAGSEPLLGMWPVLEDELAQECDRWADGGGLA